MDHLQIAWRNILRNKRRTGMAMASILVGVVALALVSGFVSTIRHALYTSVVRAEGHVQIMARHALDLGLSNPGRFHVADWPQIARTLREDPQLGPEIAVIAPVLQVAGVAGQAEAGTARSFVGLGQVPALQAQMQRWDGFGLDQAQMVLPLDPKDPDQVLVGLGLARQLQICARLQAPGCIDTDPLPPPESPAEPALRDLAAQVADELAAADTGPKGLATIDLMVAAASGAPNARSVRVGAAVEQPRRQSDNAFVAMDLRTAQNLVFEGEDKVSQILVQFRSDAYAAEGLARIRALLADHPRPLDVLAVQDFNDTFARIAAMFGLIQLFIGAVIGLIILFLIANTMAMAVMERVNEIGTIRALGESRGGVMRLFLLEGVLLGALSATAGLILSGAIIAVLNRSGLSFVTPTSTQPIPLRILFTETPGVILGLWAMITLVATLSAILPARRAARFRIVDALRFA